MAEKIRISIFKDDDIKDTLPRLTKSKISQILKEENIQGRITRIQISEDATHYLVEVGKDITKRVNTRDLL